MQEDGQTKRDHLEQVEQTTGKQLIPNIEIPPEGEHVWGWFWELNSTRGGGMGPAPLTYTEIGAWVQLTGLQVYPHEIDLIRAMDGAYMRAQSEMSKSKQKKKGK